MWAAMKNTNSIPGRPSTARCDLEQRAVHLNKLDGIVMHLEELASDETQNSLGNICSALLEAGMKRVVNWWADICRWTHTYNVWDREKKPWKLSVWSAKCGGEKKKQQNKEDVSLSLAFQVMVFEAGGNVCLAPTTAFNQWPHRNYYCWAGRNRKYKYLTFQRLKGTKRHLWGSAAGCDVEEQPPSV